MDDATARTKVEAGAKTTARLETLVAGMPIPFGGDRVALVPDALAAAFQPGDRLVVVQETGDLLHITASVQAFSASR